MVCKKRMRRVLYSFLSLLVITTKIFSSDYKADHIIYIYPKPNSELLPPATTIIVRFQSGTPLDMATDVIFTVRGRESGIHNGENVLSSDGRTFIFKPQSQFFPGEVVDVTVSAARIELNYSFSFTIMPPQNSVTTTHYQPEVVYGDDVSPSLSDDGVRVMNGISLPNDFPTLVPSIYNQQLDGMLFITTTRYVILMELDGTPYFYRQFPHNRRVWDFTTQANGYISYMVGATAYLLDDHFELSGIYKCGPDELDHNYYTDPHEFRYLSDGHTLLIAWDSRIIDMSQLVAGGQQEAEVVGTHIQELDEEKNVIFMWRSWDYFDILDALHQNLTGSLIHFVHMNAIDIDYDGHILVSSRHLDEITKINRDTGEIIWRLGGNNNQFTFLNDPDGFTYQHDIRAVPGKPGHYTLMDNGNYHSPKYSRGVEYKLDTIAKTATLVWEYRHDPDRYTHWMGNVDRQPNGNTIIGWSHMNLPKLTEVDTAGNIVYEANYTTPETAYRVHRAPWTGKAIRPYLITEEIYNDKVTLLFNTFGENVQKYYIYASQSENPTTRIDSTTNPYIHMGYLPNNTKYYFRVTSLDSSGVESDYSNQVGVNVHYVQPGQNILLNADFSQDLDHWDVYVKEFNMAQWEVDSLGQFHIKVLTSSVEPADVSLYQPNLILIQEKTYLLEFDAKSSNNGLLEIKLDNPSGSNDYSKIGIRKIITTMMRYKHTFTMEEPTDDKVMLSFNFAYTTGDFFLDNVLLAEAPSSVQETLLAQNTSYWVSENYPNPFNTCTSIRYNLPYRSSVEIVLYNVIGQVMNREKYCIKEKGQYVYNLDRHDLASGVYFCNFVIQSQENTVHNNKIVKLLCIK